VNAKFKNFSKAFNQAINECRMFVNGKQHMLSQKKRIQDKIDKRYKMIKSILNELQDKETAQFKIYSDARRKFRKNPRNKIYSIFLNFPVDYAGGKYPKCPRFRVHRELNKVTFDVVQIGSAIKDKVINDLGDIKWEK